MKQESEELMKRLAARELLAEVREFGYRPRQIKNPNGDALLEQERLLAKRIRKSKWEECLTPAELEEFKALPRKCRSDNSSGVQQPAATNEQQDDEHALTQCRVYAAYFSTMSGTCKRRKTVSVNTIAACSALKSNENPVAVLHPTVGS